VLRDLSRVQYCCYQLSIERNFAAEYGAVGGGFFNVTIKSGTNQFHGSAYDYFVNEILNAGMPFTNAGLTDSTKNGQLIRPRARRNDYGFTVGGPVEIPKLYNGKDKPSFSSTLSSSAKPRSSIICPSLSRRRLTAPEISVVRSPRTETRP
jgi:hypothetical protein